MKRGPKIIQEPENALVIGKPIISYMECNAFGNPQPTYEWHNRNGIITSAKSSRYTLTNGRLTISKPVETEDAGYYTCYAKNEFGTVRSQQVHFSFGGKYVYDFSHHLKKKIIFIWCINNISLYMSFIR